MTSGTSSRINVYFLDYWSYYGVLILNKDTNTSASGYVEVSMKDITGLHCIYLSAANLTSTSNFSFSGYSFEPGTAAPQGTFAPLSIMPGANGIYSVPVNYSQVVFCKTVYTGKTYRNFPRWSKSWSHSMGPSLLLALLLLLSLA
jgi:hypothetical protein